MHLLEKKLVLQFQAFNSVVSDIIKIILTNKKKNAFQKVVCLLQQCRRNTF